jgi:signal transduction histidine kinase
MAPFGPISFKSLNETHTLGVASKGRMRIRGRALAVVAVVAATAGGLAWIAGVPLSAWQPMVRGAVTGVALVAIALTALVLAVRFRRTRASSDAAFVIGLVLLAVPMLGSACVIPFLAVDPQGGLGHVAWEWGARTTGALVLAAGAWLSSSRRLGAALARRVLWAAVVLGNALSGAWLWWVTGPGSDLAGPAAVVGVCAVLLGLLGLVVWGLGRSGRVGTDPLVRWMTPGLTVAGAGVAQIMIEPPSGVGWLHVGDLLWLAGMLCLLVGAAQAYRLEVEEAATRRAAEERARLATQLHDGVAQDLAVVASHSRWMARQESMTREDVELVAEASTRALHRSRSTIKALRSEGTDAETARNGEE